MASNAQGKQSRRRKEQPEHSSVAQVSSRVSRAAGTISTRIEQRSNISGSKARTSASTKRGQGGSSRGTKRRPSPSQRQAPAPRSTHTPAKTGTGDTRFLLWLHNAWNNLDPHHQQRVLSILLLGLSVLLFCTLTVFRTVPVLSALYGFFMTFFGWSAYLVALGLIAFSLAHLIEGVRNQKLMRWSFVLGLVVLWMIVITESRLILGGKTGGVLATLLVSPLHGWPPAAEHILLIGLFGIVTILTFQITFGHVLKVVRALKQMVSSEQRTSSTGKAPAPSPFLGQRPRLSRYGSGLASNSAAGQRSAKVVADIDEDSETVIDFEADFDYEDADPANDINLHKQEISRIARRSLPPEPLNLQEHNQAVQGAQQQALPFEQVSPSKPRKAVQKLKTMEPLAPNPLRDTMQPPGLALESSWSIPSTNLLNNPEEVKLQMLGDDTATLAKTIQDTLRSFRVEAEVRQEDISVGPTVIRFGIRPTGKPEMKQDEKGKYVPVRDASGNIVYETRTRVNRIMALQNDLALVLEAKAIRMEAPVPGRPYVGVEIPNKNSRLVTLREVLESKEYQAAKAKSRLSIALGKDVAGMVRVGDLTRMPHLLIAGATGAGKCLAYDEPVFLADGRIVKVQELIGQHVEVIGITDTQTMQQTPVLATFTENGVREVFEIELDNGLILRRTGEHPLWAACLNENQHVGRQPDGKAARRTRAINVEWVQTKDLRVCGNRPHFDGHVVLCPLALQQKGTISRSDADIILCAFLLAEGTLSQYNLPYLPTPRFTTADPVMVASIAEAVKQYGCKVVSAQYDGKAVVEYRISRTSLKNSSGNPVARLIRDWGINGLATQKTIPTWVFQLPDEQIALFLRVFIDCDGWFCARTPGTVSVNVSLANPTLVRQLGQLALRLGITGTYTYKDNGHAGAWSWSSPKVDLWQERVGSTSKAEKLARAVRVQEENRENASTEWTAWRRARPLSDQKFADCPPGYEWRKVVSIHRITAPTVNIEVHSENHAFVGYAVEHNSVCLNTIIASLLTQATPDDTRLLMIDPKMVELNMYGGIPHLLSPVVTEVEKVVPLLKNAITEMERRYRLFSQLGVRNLDGYRKLRAEKAAHGESSLQNLPAIVIIIDELADLMMAAPEEVEGMICRLAQLARATGIHLVIATQRPSVDVITGLIKANIPTRISFMVSSAVDSRTIIDMGGAERLLGRGDMLYLPADAGRPERIQCSFLADEEAERLVAHWQQQALDHAAIRQGTVPAASAIQTAVEPGWEIREQASDDFELEDDLLDKAEEVVREYERASISLLQRRLRIGYSRAARLIDLLEERGVIGHSEVGGRAREVFDEGNGSDRRGGSGGDGRTMADEVADIIAEEKAREEFQKKQMAAGKVQTQGHGTREEDEDR